MKMTIAYMNLLLLFVIIGVSYVNGFSPMSISKKTTTTTVGSSLSFTTPSLTSSSSSPFRLYSFLPDPERESLTRDSEPEEFFATNTDKMTDKEKIPIAIAGIAVITLPFLWGLIILFTS